MLSFHNDPTIKEKYLNRLKKHAKLDHIIQGTGWKNGKGCAVGCTLENYDPKQYEIELGIPEWLAWLEDRLFELMPNKEAKEFPIRFLEAIPVGVDLDQIKSPYLIYLMEFLLNCFDNDRYSETTKLVKNVIHLYQSNEKDIKKYIKASKMAHDAADRCSSYDAYAAYAAAYSTAYAAYAPYAPYAYIESKEASIKLSNKLIELLKECE